jgi:hypothetical protein
MSFVYDSNNVKDNEQRKFQPDKVGDTAVNVISKNLQDVLESILTQLGGGVDTQANIFNVSCPIADTEYSLALPANTKSFLLKSRKSSKIKLTYVSAGTEFLTINAGAVFKDDNFYEGQTVYFKCASADEVVEVVAYV